MSRAVPLLAFILVLGCGTDPNAASGAEPERRRTDDRRQTSAVGNSRMPSTPRTAGGGGGRGGGGGSPLMENGQTIAQMLRQEALERDERARHRLTDPPATVESVLARISPEAATAIQNNGDRCDALFMMMQTDEQGRPIERFHGTRAEFQPVCEQIPTETFDCFQRGEAATAEPECRRLMAAHEARVARFQGQAERVRRGEPQPVEEPPDPLAPEELQRDQLGSTDPGTTARIPGSEPIRGTEHLGSQ